MNTIRGRGFAIRACRRSRWKYCAAVVGLASRMLPSAASWMKRSIRALECSGPEPSYPWGRSRVSRVVCPHFDSPATMKLSMITWAAFPKSPNCASQRIRLSGDAAE